MPIFSTKDLLTILTSNDIIPFLKQEFTDQGYTGDFDNPQAIERICTNIGAIVMADCSERSNFIHSMSLNTYAVSEFLTLWGKTHFGNTRFAGTKTVGDINIHLNTLQAPARSWNAGELLVEITNGQTMGFVNTGTISLSIGSNTSGSFGFIAVTEGIDGNIINDGNTAIKFIPSDVAISSSFTSADSEWWDVEGTDSESDESLRRRNSLTFSNLGSGSMVESRVRSYIYNNVPGVKDIYVDDTNPFGPHTVRIYISSDLSTSPALDVTSSLNVITGSFLRGTDYIDVAAAPEINFPYTITVYYNSSDILNSVKSKVTTTLNDWIRSVHLGGSTIGGVTNIVSTDGLIKNLMMLPQIKSVKLSSYSDISLAEPGTASLGRFKKLVAPVGGWETACTFISS